MKDKQDDQTEMVELEGHVRMWLDTPPWKAIESGTQIQKRIAKR